MLGKVTSEAISRELEKSWEIKVSPIKLNSFLRFFRPLHMTRVRPYKVGLCTLGAPFESQIAWIIYFWNRNSLEVTLSTTLFYRFFKSVTVEEYVQVLRSLHTYSQHKYGVVVRLCCFKHKIILSIFLSWSCSGRGLFWDIDHMIVK